MTKISQLKAKFFDSRGFPTLEADVYLEMIPFGRACISSGASTGSLEACELQDGDASKLLGKGVLKQNNTQTKIAATLIGKEAGNQQAIDKLMIDLDATKTNQT